MSVFQRNRIISMVCNDALVQTSEDFRLVENPSSGQIADLDSLSKVFRLQCGGLACCRIAQSLSAIVSVDDHGEIEEALTPDLSQVALEVQELAKQEEVGRTIADTDLCKGSSRVTHGFTLCGTASVKCSKDFAGNREKN